MLLKSLPLFLQEQMLLIPIPDGLTKLILALSNAAKLMAVELSRNAINSVSNTSVDTWNTHGEKQHKLDLIAHEIFLNAVQDSKVCGTFISEECDGIIDLNNRYLSASNYILCLDPLDGSSNIDANVSVGSIFSIYDIPRSVKDNVECIKNGRQQRASGYFIYGT